MNQLAKICTGILIVAIVGCSSSTTNERDNDHVASGSASAGTPTTTESPHIGGAGGNVGTVVGAGSSALDPPGQGGSTMTGTALVSGGSGGSVTTSFDAGGAVSNSGTAGQGGSTQSTATSALGGTTTIAGVSTIAGSVNSTGGYTNFSGGGAPGGGEATEGGTRAGGGNSASTNASSTGGAMMTGGATGVAGAAPNSGLCAGVTCVSPRTCEIGPGYCDLVTGQCAYDLAPPSRVCRAAVNYCDPIESCTGLDPQCPADVVRNLSATCEDVTGFPALTMTEALVAPPEGDMLSYACGVNIQVPPGAVTSSVPIEVTTRKADVLVWSNNAKPLVQGEIVAPVVELQPGGTSFAVPLVIELPLFAPRSAGEILAVLQMDPSGGGFVPGKLTDGSEISGIVGPSGQSVFFAVDHFSIYAVLAKHILSAHFQPDTLSVDGMELQIAVPKNLFSNALAPTVALYNDQFRQETYANILYELFRAKAKGRPPLLADLASKYGELGKSADVIKTSKDVLAWAKRINVMADAFAELYPKWMRGVHVGVKQFSGTVQDALSPLVESGTLEGGPAVDYFKCVVKGYLAYLVNSQIDRAMVEDRIAALDAVVSNSSIAQDPQFAVAWLRATERVRLDYADDTNAGVNTLKAGLLQGLTCAGGAAWDMGKEYLIKSIVTGCMGVTDTTALPLALASWLVEDWFEKDVLEANRNTSKLILMGSLFHFGGFNPIFDHANGGTVPDIIDMDNELERHHWVNMQTGLDLLSRIAAVEQDALARADMSYFTHGFSYVAEWLASKAGDSTAQERINWAATIAIDTKTIDDVYDQVGAKLLTHCTGDPVACLPAGTAIAQQDCAAASTNITALLPGMTPLRDYACGQSQHRYQLHTSPGRKRYSFEFTVIGGAIVTAASKDPTSLSGLPACQAPECVADTELGGTLRRLTFGSTAEQSVTIAVRAGLDSRYLIELTEQCLPLGCADAAAQCGSIDDGCGGTVSCGECPTGSQCGPTTPNKCEVVCDPCNAPPPPLCATAGVRRTFAATGTCIAGQCTYEPIDTACDQGMSCVFDTGNCETIAGTGGAGGGSSGAGGAGGVGGAGGSSGYVGGAANGSAGSTGSGGSSAAAIVAVPIAAGAYHNCALVSGGVQCWGYNYAGQLGNNNNSQTYSPVPVQVQNLSTGVAAVAAGGDHSCALVNGGVKCWGYNSSGELGNNRSVDSRVPVQVQGLSTGVTAVAAGNSHTCALVNGGVKCWGNNIYGSLGDNSTTESRVPVQVQGLSVGVTAIAAGYAYTCALTNGGVQCWGYNNHGQLGNNTTSNSPVPVQVQGLTSGVTGLALGSGHACALTNGGVQCWGYNFSGQLGTNSQIDSAVPVQVQDLTTGVTAITAGQRHSCALVNGGVQCWGCNSYGQIGNNSQTDSAVPVQVQDLTTGVATITAGMGHTCALLEGGLARCWGYNVYGQLGIATRVDNWIPVTVSGFTGLIP